jgi:hypothetical protein
MLQALVGALEAWPNSDLTCHATLQCLVALCKDNAMMKANVTVTALKPVLQVLRACGSCSAIAERGFTLLAVLQVFALQNTVLHDTGPQSACSAFVKFFM